MRHTSLTTNCTRDMTKPPSGRERSIVALTLSLLGSIVTAQSLPVSARAFAITHYDVELRPQLDAHTVDGLVSLTVQVPDAGTSHVTLNRGVLEIDEVMEGGRPLTFQIDSALLQIELPPGNDRRARTIAVRYHGRPTSGLVFAPEREQLYTIFSTPQWMPSVDDPGARATVRLRLHVPRPWTGAASGRQISRRPVSAGVDVVEWLQERPMPAYTFGFAVGRFSEVSDRELGVTLQYFADGFSPDEIRAIFGESRQILRFFEERSGVPYPWRTYAQALVARTAGQEMAGLSLVSEEYGRAVLADRTAIGLLAHEFSHQWWGNMVTCHAWTEFWLNEGFATFMAAAYRERRFGRATYLADISAMRTRYEQVVARGNDRALVFPSWNRPSADDRTLVYQKGALLLHDLRERVGDSNFWKGVRLYTRRNFGRSVTTEALRLAFEEASGVDLRELFAPIVGVDAKR
jgi:aminopeptidase N